MYSLWCDTLYSLSLANHFRNKIFWMPHNMDFRLHFVLLLRITFVSILTASVNNYRSRLSLFPASHAPFARHGLITTVLTHGKSLGPNGINWLKLHVINFIVTKKREPVSARLVYADNPLDGTNVTPIFYLFFFAFNRLCCLHREQSGGSSRTSRGKHWWSVRKAAALRHPQSRVRLPLTHTPGWFV